MAVRRLIDRTREHKLQVELLDVGTWFKVHYGVDVWIKRPFPHIRFCLGRYRLYLGFILHPRAPHYRTGILFRR